MPTERRLLYVNESSVDPSNFYLSKLTASIGLLAKAKEESTTVPGADVPDADQRQPAQRARPSLPQQDPVSGFRRVLQICVGTADAAPLGTPQKLETLEGLKKRPADTFTIKRSSNRSVES